MRITQSEMFRNFSSDLETLNETYGKVSRQVSSGKKLTQLQDDPGSSAELLSLSDQSSDNDVYQSNANTISYYLGTADSALSNVNNLVTSIYSDGSQAASDSMSSDARASLATEIRSLRDQILSLANTQANGRYIFAGSDVTTAPFQINGDSVSYGGDSEVNTVSVDQETEVQSGVPGSQAFNSVFSSIESLLTAVDSNDVSGIGTALSQFSSAFSALGLARGTIGSNMTLLQNVQAQLQVESTSITTQQSNLQDADMAQATVQMSQAQTALDAAMAAGGSILQQKNLFDILG
jgi:flagellar hook-associated protein 3 FlgL